MFNEYANITMQFEWTVSNPVFVAMLITWLENNEGQERLTISDMDDK